MQTPLTPLVTPYLKAERTLGDRCANVYLCIPGARVLVAHDPSLRIAMQRAASLLDVLALGARCEADMIHDESELQEITLTEDYGHGR